MTTDTENFSTIFDGDPVLGDYVSHHPCRREILLLQGAIAYGVPVGLLQLLFLNDTSTLISIALPTIYGVLGLAVGWYIMHLWNREVVLYERGFTYREGSREAALPYATVVELYGNVERTRYFNVWTREVYDYQMVTDQDERLTIGNLYTDVRQLVDRLEAYITRDRLPIAQEKLRRDETLFFGAALQLRQSGIRVDGADLAWDDFGGYRIAGGKIHLLDANGETWQSVPAQEMPNTLLLLRLLKQNAPAPALRSADTTSTES